MSNITTDDLLSNIINDLKLDDSVGLRAALAFNLTRLAEELLEGMPIPDIMPHIQPMNDRALNGMDSVFAKELHSLIGLVAREAYVAQERDAWDSIEPLISSIEARLSAYHSSIHELRREDCKADELADRIFASDLDDAPDDDDDLEAAQMRRMS